MSLVLFLDLAGASVVVESNAVRRLNAVPVELLPTGVPAGTRIELGGGVASTPEAIGAVAYQDVQGTVVATATALGAGPTTGFGDDFDSAVQGAQFLTTSAAFVPVPGVSVARPASGQLFILITALIGTDTAGSGVEVAPFVDGVQFGGSQIIPATGAVAGEVQASYAAHLLASGGTGDVELHVRALPGGGVEQASVAGLRITLWQI